MLFHYSIKNRHVLAELQKAYGVKTLQVVKAATTRWLSHGAACKRCREVFDNSGSPWWCSLGKSECKVDSLQIHFARRETVFEISFLEDVLGITNVLCLVLQTDKKYFAAISRAVSNCIKILEEIQTNENADLLKSFNSLCTHIVKKTEDYQMQLTVSGSTRRKHAGDRLCNDKDQFYERVIKLFCTDSGNERGI